MQQSDWSVGIAMLQVLHNLIDSAIDKISLAEYDAKGLEIHPSYLYHDKSWAAWDGQE